MLNNMWHPMCQQQQHLPHRPQSAHETISSHFPVFLFSISSPRQKSQYLLALTVLLADGVAAAVVIESATAAARLLTTVNQKQHQKINRKWLLRAALTVCMSDMRRATTERRAQHWQQRTRKETN